MAVRYGAEMTVLDWRERLVCSQCGSRNIDGAFDWKVACSRWVNQQAVVIGRL